ncbi:MAG: VanZ family protein [Nitrospirae bacterium]|jgi:VanZ family protein|nr:VanZ family protein [Nitrospirota bacterium]
MIYFIYYWLPLLAWMLFIFPTNDSLTADSTFSIIVPVLKWFLPDASQPALETIHGLIRKFSHFLGYGFLAYLLFRAFRGKSRIFRHKWILYAGLISVGYGLLDEFFQTLITSRTGSFYDWMIDVAGAISVLVIIYHKNKAKG